MYIFGFESVYYAFYLGFHHFFSLFLYSEITFARDGTSKRRRFVSSLAAALYIWLMKVFSLGSRFGGCDLQRDFQSLIPSASAFFFASSTSLYQSVSL